MEVFRPMHLASGDNGNRSYYTGVCSKSDWYKSVSDRTIYKMRSQEEDAAPQSGRLQVTNNKQDNLAIISLIRGFEHQVKEKQKYSDTPASEYNTSDPGRLHMTVVVTGGDDVVCVLTPPSQHARIAVARAVEVGELEHTCEDDGEGVATCDQYRQSTKESGGALGQVGRVESPTWGAVVVFQHFGVVGKVTG